MSFMNVVYRVNGMACRHCAEHVRKALETLPGVKAVVTLDPAEARIEFSGRTYGLQELQETVAEKAGDYILSEKQ